MKFGELLDEVGRVTGLDETECFQVARALWSATNEPEDSSFSEEQMREQAEQLGFDVTRDENVATKHSMKGTRITMDPSEVLAEVYKFCPRVLAQEIPTVKTDEEGVSVMLGSIFVSQDGAHAMFTVIDEANSTIDVEGEEDNVITRTIGPVDLADYGGTIEGLERAVKQAIGTFERSIRADWN